jgi:nitrite reductase (NO-forming)
VVETEVPRSGPDRRLDRRLAVGGLAATVAFLAAAVGSLALPADARLGTWLPLHLALAGGAATAIAAMVPFFVAALAVAPPASPVLRGGSIALVVAGGTLAALGRAAQMSDVAALGAWLDVAGFAGVGLATALPLRRAAGPRRRLTEAAYFLALANVLVGVLVAALFLGGDPGVGARWAALKPAHGWLNLFGFACVVIAGTLVHFAPTVAGSRIRRRPAGVVAVAGLAAGAPLAALGYASDSALLGQIGAVATLTGAVALAAHGLGAQRDRAGWTTERAWHAITAGFLLLAPVWLVVAAAAAAARVVTFGVDPAGWRLSELLAPLVVGVVGQVLLGALSFLVPALSAGPPERHARQRRRLGRLAAARLIALNAGVGLLTVRGFLVGAQEPAPTALIPDALAVAGLVLALGSIATTLGLLAGALVERERERERGASGGGLDRR